MPSAGATLLPRASAGRYAALPTPQAQVAGPTQNEAASDVLRGMFEAKTNEGTLAGQAAEFMAMMARKVRRLTLLCFAAVAADPVLQSISYTLLYDMAGNCCQCDTTMLV